MDVKIALNRRIVGDPVTLACLGEENGIWVKPRKFSVVGQDAIRAITIPRSAALAKLRAAIEDKGGAASDADGGLTEEGLRARDEAAIEKLTALDGFDAGKLAVADVMRAQLKYGVAEHNFDGDPRAPTEAWIDQVLDDPELAEEIVGIVGAFNRPLARRTSAS